MNKWLRTVGMWWDFIWDQVEENLLLQIWRNIYDVPFTLLMIQAVSSCFEAYGSCKSLHRERSNAVLHLTELKVLAYSIKAERL